MWSRLGLPLVLCGVSPLRRRRTGDVLQLHGQQGVTPAQQKEARSKAGKARRWRAEAVEREQRAKVIQNMIAALEYEKVQLLVEARMLRERAEG